MRILLLILLIINTATAQRSSYPKGYFAFPIKPNQENSLSGSFGDLRTNHFHTGLDIRTDQREGLPVYAAADGYIDKIRVMNGGYGNVIYMKHPNGFTTVYGHLKFFAPSLQQAVRESQYSQESFEVELDFKANQYFFRKGELIALSGNSGSSGGPHLHFEIRDAQELAVNPLFFGFNEIPDNIAPSIERIALRPLSADGFVNADINKYQISPFSQGFNNYSILAPIPVYGEIGLEVLVSDRTSSSPFKTGISQIEVQVDGRSVYWFNLEKVPFDFGRDINAHIDFAQAETNGTKFQKCYKLEGNRLDVYSTDYNNGKIVIRDNQSHQVFVMVKDANNNMSSLNFTLQGQEPNLTNLTSLNPTQPVEISTFVDGNVLNIKAKNVKSSSSTAKLIKSGKQKELTASIGKDNETIFRHDLKQGIPENIEIEDGQARTGIKQAITINGGTFSEPNLTVHFGQDLYETLYLKTAQNGTRLSIADEKTALKGNIEVNWQPTGAYSSDKSAVYYVNDGRKYLGGKWGSNGISFKTKELGDFQLLNDYNSPTISPIQIDTNSVRFRIKDDLSGVRSFRCTINGEWLLMNYDAKNSVIWSEKYEESDVLDGILRLEVTDNSGNVAIFEQDIYEYIIARKNAIKRRPKSSSYKGKKSKRKKR
jgi:hypothetical protein